MNRRSFIQSFAALAAAAVAGPTLAKLSPTDLERLEASMLSGVVEDQTFLFTEPITLAINNLVILRCRFFFRMAKHYEHAILVQGSGLTMRNCVIDTGSPGYFPEALIVFS